MLPLVTRHNVEMVLRSVLKVVIVLCVCVESEVALQLFAPTIVTIVRSQWRSWCDVCILLSLCNVSTSSNVQAQVFKSVNLIVELCICYYVAAARAVVLQIQYSHRVLCCLSVQSSWPCWVFVCSKTSTTPFEIVTKVSSIS